MTLVKGSKILRVKVIEYRLRNIILSIFAIGLALAVAVVASYFYGHKLGMSGQQQALKDVTRLSGELHEQQASVRRLEQQLANAKTFVEVDRKASEDVRQEVILLKDEIARLEEENNFYRGLMAPNEQARGLTLGAVELVSTSSERRYVYKVVVQQLASRHNLLSGNLSYAVLGTRAGEAMRIPLKDLSDTVSTEKIKLRFKYFQVVEGELVLPDGFDPDGVAIKASTTGANAQTVEKKFGWLVEER